MTEIKYELRGKILCMTRCPFGLRKFGEPIRVASRFCLKCEHWLSEDKENSVVICGNPGKDKRIVVPRRCKQCGGTGTYNRRSCEHCEGLGLVWRDDDASLYEVKGKEDEKN